MTRPDECRGLVARVIYELSFRGAASEALQAAFERFEIIPKRGFTVVRGSFADQAELHALLDRIQGLRLELLDVTLVAEPEPSDIEDWESP
jgi:hypothetical protein